MPENTPGTGSSKKANRTSWKPGQSGNPKGAPKRGESWAEVIKVCSELTPLEASELCTVLAHQLAELGDAISMKQAIVLRAMLALMSEPNAALLKAIMERAEGVPVQPVALTDWRQQAEQTGEGPDELFELVVGYLMKGGEEGEEDQTEPGHDGVDEADS